MDGIVALLLSKKFTKDTVIGMGAIKGAACQVQSINKVGKTTTITLKWEDNVGGVHTQAFDVEDGLDGVSVSNATIKSNGHLELTLSDGNTIDCGKVLPQYDTMPTPSSSNEGQILQYIGTTTSNYTNGYFYECINDGGTYKWVEKLVQDSYTKIQIGDLSNLPDNTKNVVENIVDINSKLDDKENVFRYNVIPTADVSINGAIIQYIGATNATYTNGYYYQCVESPVGSGTYVWVQKNVQPNNGGGGGDGVVDGYYNSADQLFYEDSAFLNPITGEDNTIYVDLNTNGLYRYDGTIFIKVSSSAENIQVITLPTADVTQLDKIYQYIGVTDTNYTKGYFYRCILDGSVYKWVETPTQDSYTKAEIGQLSDLPDPSKTVIENIDLLNGSVLNIKTDINTLQGSVINVKNDITNLQGSVLNIKTDINTLQGSLANKVDKEAGKGLSTNDYTNDDKQKLVKLSPIYLIGSGLNLDSVTGELTASGIDVPIDTELSDTSINPVQNKVITTKIEQLEASKLSLSDVDNALSGSSINPVQNQVITLAIDQLQGSVLNKIQKMLGAQEDNFTVIDNNGGVKDSGISKNVVPATASTSNKLLVASDLSVKADKVSGAVDNDIALLDNTGNLKDSTKKLSDLQDKLTEGDGIDIDVNNKISVDISYLTASRIGYIPNTEKGAVNGVAELDSTGKVPSSQLPSNELNDLGDVVITSPINKQILAYNSTSGKWENQTGQETIGGIVPKGSILFANLPTTGMSNGDAYDIKDAFVTDNRFEEGSGIECGAGTDIVWIADENKWNILTPAGVYSFNGRTGAVLPATSDYDADQIDYDNTTSDLTATNIQDAIDENVSNLSSHTSNISNPHNVTKSQIGLENVVNTGDSDTPVSGGTTKFTTGGAYTELNKKADKVSSATNGHLAGLDSNGNLTDSGVVANDVIQKVATATGLLKDDGTVDTTTYASSANAYLVGDTAETTIDDTDYFPFYDTSATEKRKTLWSNIKSKLKTYFDGLYATILPASSPTPTEASVVSDINGVSASTTKAASAYALQQYSNEKKIRRVITGTTPIGSASIGTTGIGTWDDSATPTEIDWWYDDAFKIPDNRNDIDLSLKFDPSSGEPVTLGGYILDTDTGKLCIKFGNSIATPANAKIAVDITYTRNEFG